MTKKNKKVKEKNSLTKDEQKLLEAKIILIQKTIPRKILNMLASSWWAIFILVGIYLLYFSAIFYGESYYSTMNQTYKVKDLHLWSFYVYNIHILFSIFGTIAVILVLGYYLSMGYILTKNKIVLLFLIAFILIILTIADTFKKSADIHKYTIAIIVISIIIWALSMIIIRVSKHNTKNDNKYVGNILIDQSSIVSYGIAMCGIFSICILALLARIFIQMGEKDGIAELNKKMYESNTPNHIKIKYFEKEISTITCTHLYCIKLGKIKEDSF